MDWNNTTKITSYEKNNIYNTAFIVDNAAIGTVDSRYHT